MRTWSIPLGRVFGIDLRMHLTFLFLAIFILTGALEPHGGGVTQGLLLSLIIAVSVILHELGHVLVANVRGMPPRLIMLLPIGGVHIHDRSESSHPPSAKDEIVVSIAGPLISLLAGIITGLVILTVHPDADLLARPLITAAHLGKSMVWVNIFLAALNLVPAYPLDGGRILRTVLAHSDSGDERVRRADATRRVVMMGQVFATFLMFAGIWNPSLMLIGFFLFVAVQMEDRTLMFQSVIESVKLEEIMLTDFSTLSPADTLQDALSKAVHSLQDDFPVIRGSDMVGVISKQNIIEALREHGNGYVQSAMKRAFEIAGKNEPLSAAFRKITSRGATIIPIVDGERLVGIVTLQNLMHSMGLLAETKKLQRELE